MTIRHLKTFLCVAETGSITGAAKKLYVSQPSVSLTIRELESYYQVKLFERLGKKIQITESGKLFYSYASHLIRIFDEMETAVKSAQSLRIGSSITLGTKYIPRYVREFHNLFPQVQVHVTVASSGQIEDQVLSGELDLGFIEGAIHSERLISHTFMRDTLVPICASSLAVEKAGSLSQFLENPLLLRERGSGTRELFEERMNLLGISVEPCWESSSNEALIHGVLWGNGVSVISQKLVQELVEAGSLRIPDIPELKLARHFRYLYHKNKFITPAMENFLSLVDQGTDLAAAGSQAPA